MPPTKEIGGSRKHNTLLPQVQIENSGNSSSCENTFGRRLDDPVLSFSYNALKNLVNARLASIRTSVYKLRCRKGDSEIVSQDEPSQAEPTAQNAHT